MAHRQASGRDFVPDFVGQLQQPQEVRDRRAILPHRGRDVFLRQLEFVGEAAVGERLFDRVQVLALDVLDERHLEERLLLPRRDVAHDDRDAEQAGALRGAPAALARDDLEAVADLADDDRLDDAVGLDGLRQLLEPRVVDVPARLEIVRRETIDVGLDG